MIPILRRYINLKHLETIDQKLFFFTPQPSSGMGFRDSNFEELYKLEIKTFVDIILQRIMESVFMIPIYSNFGGR